MASRLARVVKIRKKYRGPSICIEEGRKFLQAENELVQINKLEESPKNDDVRSYMRMNEKLAEGLVA